MFSVRGKKAEQGVVLILLAAGLGLLMSFLIFTVDIARAYTEKRKLQMIADAASLAALNRLGVDVSFEGILARVLSVAHANGVTFEEAAAVVPRCGVWSSAGFAPAPSGVCDEVSNSVEVTIQRSLPLYFPRLLAKESLMLEGRSISYLPPSPHNCIRPFGIEESALISRNVVEGGTFTVNGTQSSGNWGKIDLDGNSSSGTVYTQLMLNNLCDDQFAPGNWVSAGTGNAQISQVFQTIHQDITPPLAGQNMVFAVTSDFPPGNGQVQIRRFMRVDLVSQRGTGQGWSATFRIVQMVAQPDDTATRRRQLVE